MIEEQTLLDNRYRILERLGCGGMAEVHLCRDEQLGREVALKVLREQYANDEEFVGRFAREARSAASLSHPNVASVYDLGRSRGGSYYIVMEYVCNGTLAEYLGRRGPLPTRTAAEVAEQIASALGAAHAEGVIHRDVKPHNVLISAEGDVKLADFGIARATANPSVSATGRVLGTAGYMSPEQALGKQTTPRSDLYSLGGVLYEMLTGEVPFEADTPVAVSLKHVSERPHHPAQVNPEVPEEMDAVVMRLLAKDPDDRYESAEALAEDLARIRDGLPPVSVSAVDGPVPAGAPSAAVAGGGDGADGAEEALPAAASGKGRRRRRKLLLSFAPLVVLVLLAAVLLGPTRGSGEGGVIGSLDGAPGNVIGEAREVVEDAEQALLGPQEATIPEVEGLSEEQARRSLDERGFTAEVRTMQSPEDEAGVVLEQSAPGGQRAEQGSTILLAVGAGPGSTGGSGSAGDGPAEDPGAAGGQASVPDGSGRADDSDTANLGGGDSGNDGDGGSNGASQGSGGYTVPPATNEDEASRDSASVPVGPPETYAPPQALSQPSPAPPGSRPESWQAPASSSPREAATGPVSSESMESSPSGIQPSAQEAPVPTTGSPDRRGEVSGNHGSADVQSPAPEPIPQSEPEASPIDPSYPQNSDSSAQGSSLPATQWQMPAQPPAQPSGELSGGTAQAQKTPTADVEPLAEVPLPDTENSSAGDLLPEVPGTDSAGNAADQYAPTPVGLSSTVR